MVSQSTAEQASRLRNSKCNPPYPVDALFNSVSAVTVTGLTTINLSGLTGWQQALLYIQMVGGNIVSQPHIHRIHLLNLCTYLGHCIVDHGDSAKTLL